MPKIFKDLAEFQKAMNEGKVRESSVFNLTGKKLKLKDVKILADILASGKGPADLSIDLWDCNIGNEGAKLLAAALQSGMCPPGLQLHLWNNNLNFESAIAFAGALSSGKCPPRLILNLFGNQLGSSGAMIFGVALASGHCPSGLYLNLASNDIQKEGAKGLATGIASNKAPLGLQLNISNNPIGESIIYFRAEIVKGTIPVGFKLYFENAEVHRPWATEIKSLLQFINQSELKNSAMNCLAFQHGAMDASHSIKRLPKDIVSSIYSYVYPFVTTPQLKQQFSNKIHSFFQQEVKKKEIERSEKKSQLI